MKSQRGNALWFVLIAIVLLGALTMLLTRGGSSVSQSGDVEQLRVRASQLTRYAQGMAAAIDQMKMRGISDSDISFENVKITTSYANPSCSKPDCKVFDAAGGGEDYRAPPDNVNDGSEWIFTGANNVGSTNHPVGTTAAGTGNDLVMLLPNAKPDLCIQLNRDLHVGTPGIIPEDHSGTDLTPFTGTYANSLSIIDGDPLFVLDGKTAGCFVSTNATPNVIYFYYVLLAR